MENTNSVNIFSSSKQNIRLYVNRELFILPSHLVGREGFEPPKAYASRFTVCPSWPLWYLPIKIFLKNGMQIYAKIFKIIRTLSTLLTFYSNNPKSIVSQIIKIHINELRKICLKRI